jgi:hypothetical protein
VSVLAGIFDDLDNMSQLQLLLAFTSCIAAVFATGGMLSPRGRLIASAAALGSALGFIASSNHWPNAVMIATLGVAGLGLFTAAVWLLTRLIGLEPRGRNASLRPDSIFPADAAAPPSPPQARPQHDTMAPT